MAEQDNYRVMKALQAWYDRMYQSVAPQYIGPGKRFATEKEFKDYVGGVGRGLEESFSGGAVFDKDPTLQKLTMLGRTAHGGYRGHGLDEAIRLYGNDPEFQAIYDSVGGDGQGGRQGGPTADEDAQYQAWRKQTLQRLDQFSKEMNLSIPELLAKGDMGIQNVSNMAAGNAGRAAYGAGLGGGGISNLNSQRAVADAQLGYQTQRQAMGLQATNMLMGGLQNEYMNQEDRYRYQQGLDMQLQNTRANAEAYDAQRQQQMWQAVGSVFGGVAGGAANYAQGGSFMGGFQTGSQLGGGLGGALGGIGYQPYQYQYPSGNRPRGLGGGSRGGGSGNPYSGAQ